MSQEEPVSPRPAKEKMKPGRRSQPREKDLDKEADYECEECGKMFRWEKSGEDVQVGKV